MTRDFPRALALAIAASLCLASARCTIAQELTSDANTLLLLHCNNSMNGFAGETPTLLSGIAYNPAGIFGAAVSLNSGNQVLYASSANILASQGTVEFWFRPAWNGNDGQGHWIASWGAAGGILMGKDGGNTWRIILNRSGTQGHPEAGAGLNVSDWVAGQWRHCAFTWSSVSLKTYVDGTLRDQANVGFAPPAITGDFRVGADGSEYASGLLDEFRISDRERTNDEIEDDYLKGVSIQSLQITPDPLELYETWWVAPQITANTTSGPIQIPSRQMSWNVGNPARASVDAQGRIVGLSAGSTTVTGTRNGISDAITVNVHAPVRPPDVDALDSFLTTPAVGALFDMPVLILRYIPTQDGINVDPSLTGWTGTVSALRAMTDTYNRRVKFMLEEGSRFHGARNPSALPSLGYRIVGMITVYEPLPRGKSLGGGTYYPDYDQIVRRWSGDSWVQSKGVKEIWLWGYHFNDIAPAESNMSSPTTGDISNSARFEDDLPIYDRTYVLYNYNYTRTQNEAVHNHGHQLEAILGYVAQRQDGNSDLFWKKFVGQDASGNFVTGRCGWTHMPPNTTSEYDYQNPTLVSSDIEDWRPDGTGQHKMVNANTWGSIPYAWPAADAPDALAITEAQFYIYWMQNMPGRNNLISYNGGLMNNWWTFTANWDASIHANTGLYNATTGVPVAPGIAGSIRLTARPNPSRNEVTLDYVLPWAGDVSVTIHDVAGKRVRVLDRGSREAGAHRMHWDALDEGGVGLQSGVFYVTLEFAGTSVTRRIVLLR
jgi:hypothetical protein